jgi:cytidyltransferase-like protein
MIKGLVYGEFDILTLGHLSFLEKAKASCNYLYVALRSMPVESFKNREQALLSTDYVDEIIMATNLKDLHSLIQKLSINVYIVGNGRNKLEIDGLKTQQVDSERLYIPFLTVCTGQLCNLKCRDCGNLSPFSPRDALHYNVDKIINDLSMITECADIRLLQVQGGEAFIYPELNVLLKFVIDSSAIHQIQISTNGTKMPNVELELLKDKKICVRISDYECVKSISNRLKQHLDSNGCKNRSYRFAAGIGEWYDMGRGFMHTSTRAALNFHACAFNNCLTLENGLLGRCSRATIAPRIQGFSPAITDYFKVEHMTDFRQSLAQYVNNPKYMEACRYCNGTSEESQLVEAAIQIKRKT